MEIDDVDLSLSQCKQLIYCVAYFGNFLQLFCAVIQGKMVDLTLDLVHCMYMYCIVVLAQDLIHCKCILMYI